MKGRFFQFNYKNKDFLYDSESGELCESNIKINKIIEKTNLGYDEKGVKVDLAEAGFDNLQVEEAFRSISQYVDMVPEKEDKTQIIRINKNVKKDEWYSGKVLSNMWLSIAHNCNMKCKYCFANGGVYEQSSMMTKDIAQKCIDYFFKYVKKDAKTISVNFFGGEPLLNKEVFSYSTNYINENARNLNLKVKYILTTNGTIMDDEILDIIIKNKMTTNISIDGDRTIHNTNRIFADGRPTFDIVEKNIKKILSKYKNVIARVTLTKPGVVSFKSDILKLWELGFEDVYIDIVDTPIKELAIDRASFEVFKQQLEQVYKEMEDNVDRGIPRYFSNIVQLEDEISKKIIKAECKYYNPFTIKFTPQGDIYKCSMTFGNKEHCVGNINDGIVWEKFIKHYKVDNKCTSCWAKRICGGGCPLKPKDELFCNYQKTMAELSLKFHAFLIESDKGINNTEVI